MKKQRLALIIIVAVTSSLLIFSCSNKENKKEAPKDENKTEQKANAANNSPKADPSIKQAPNVFEISSVKEGKSGQIIDFTWKENGKEMSFAEFAKNKVAFVNLWGTWCPPCREEIPDLIEVSNELAKSDFVMIGVALERNPDNAFNAVSEFAAKKGITYKLFIDKSQKFVEECSKNLGAVNAVPTSYIFDKSGKIKETIVGGKKKNEFLASINKIMK